MTFRWWRPGKAHGRRQAASRVGRGRPRHQCRDARQCPGNPGNPYGSIWRNADVRSATVQEERSEDAPYTRFVEVLSAYLNLNEQAHLLRAARLGSAEANSDSGPER